MIQRRGRARFANIAFAAATVFLVITVQPAAAQTWVGPGADWNTASNWSPAIVPNSPTAAVNFTGVALGNVNISSSVSAQSLSFSNPTGTYTLTSSPGVILSSLTGINVAAGVTGTQTINLANISGGSLLFASGNNLTIDNISTAPGTTLLIGSNTVIGTPGSGGVIVNGTGTTEIAGTFASAASGNHVVGGLTKNGSGTLILSNPNNVYFGGTLVNGGTLQLGSGTAIPTGSNVTVASGAQFNIGGFGNNSGTAIGNLTLNGGTFRVPSGNADYYLNQLTMTGGSVDFTGTSNFWLHFTGAGAGINLNSGTNDWLGSSASRIQNDTGAPLTINVNPSATLNAGIILSSGGSNPNFTIDGGGSVRLSNIGNTGNIRVSNSRIYSNDLSTNVGSGAYGTLGNGTLTLSGGTLSYDGPSAASAKPIDLSGGGTIEILTNANLTMSGLISESSAGSALSVFGAGLIPNTLTLTGANSYTGRTSVARNGILAIPTIANGGVNSPIGAGSNSPSNLVLGASDARGTLLLTGTNATYSTDRGLSVNGLFANGGGGVIGVQNAATNLTWSGQITGSGQLIKSGPGTLTLTNFSNNFAGGTLVEAGRLGLGPGAAMPIGGHVTVLNGAEFNIGTVSNASGSAIGTVALSGGTFRVPGGNGDYYLNRLEMTGGTVDFTGTGNFWLHFTGAGAGITSNSSSTTANWIGAPSSRIQNDTAGPLTITVSQGSPTSGIALDAGIILSGSGTNPNFTLTDFGVIRLTNPGNTANLLVKSGFLRVDDVTSGPSGNGALGTGSLTFDNSFFRYGGPTTATLAKPIVLAPTGGVGSVGVILQNSSPGTVLTLGGAISQTGAGADSLFVDGVLELPDRGAIALTGANTYTGSTAVYGLGVLSVPTVTNAGVPGPLGAASASPNNLILGGLNRGTLRLTGNAPSYSTNRGLSVYNEFFPGYSILGGAIDVVNAGTNLTIGGQITGTPGTLIKQGAGTLTLTNTTNNYSEGTVVEAGRLAMGASGPVIPTNSNLIVLAGAIFDAATFGNSPASPGNPTPIGTLNLQGGTFLATGGPTGGDTTFHLNRLEMIGGIVDFSPGQFYRFEFENPGASIRTFASSSPSVLIGAANHFFENNGNAPVSIDVALGTTSSGVDLDVGLGLRHGFANSTFVKTGPGTMRLTNLTNNTADIIVSQGRLRVDDVTANGGLGAFGTGSVTLDGGAFLFTQPSATAMKPFTLGTSGGGIEVANVGTNLTIGGALSGTGALVKSGPGVMTLNNSNNTYAGGTVVSTGRLEVANDAYLGSSTGHVTINPLGTLRYTSSTTTARTFSLFNGTLEVPTGVNLSMNAATVGGGFLRGAGTFTLSGGTALTGVATFTNTNLNVTGSASIANFSHNGSLTVASGQSLSMNYGTVGSAGRMTVNGTANITEFVSNGVLTVPAGGLINNTNSTMTLGGGSTTFVGSVANPGGKIDLGGQQLHVRGGLLVTNGGTFGSGNGVRNGTTVADFGSVVKGTGPYDSVITQNGGQFLPGNSPGTSQVGTFNLNGGGGLIFQITDAGPSVNFPSAPGTAGANPGWGLTQVFTSLNFTATPASPFTITMQTQLPPPAASDTPGLMSNFDPTQSYSWLIFDLQSGATFNGTFNPAAINFATAQFVNPTAGGVFSLTTNASNAQIFLTFTPVPEARQVIAVALVAGAIGFGWRRRNWRKSTSMHIGALLPIVKNLHGFDCDHALATGTSRHSS